MPAFSAFNALAGAGVPAGGGCPGSECADFVVTQAIFSGTDAKGYDAILGGSINPTTFPGSGDTVSAAYYIENFPVTIRNFRFELAGNNGQNYLYGVTPQDELNGTLTVADDLNTFVHDGGLNRDVWIFNVGASVPAIWDGTGDVNVEGILA